MFASGTSSRAVARLTQRLSAKRTAYFALKRKVGKHIEPQAAAKLQKFATAWGFCIPPAMKEKRVRWA